MGESKKKIVITGTDPESSKGGIGVVLPGYFLALFSAGYPYECIPTYHPAFPGGKWRLWLMAFPVLLRSIQRIKRDGGLPVVYSHAGDGVSFLRETSILWVARMAGAKTVLQVHSPKVDGYLKQPVARSLVKIALLPADTVCVLTPWWRGRLQEAGVRARIRVIPNPLPSDLQAAAESEQQTVDTGKEGQSITVLSMARLVSGKGVDVMIQAMSHLPEKVQLIVAGDGVQRPALDRLVDELKLGGRVQFAGWVSGEEKVKLLEQADIFCLPSTYDAFPMSIVEAMAHGLPVVAVKWGGIPDMVADGRVGILVNTPQPAAIAVAIEQLLDKGRRKIMGDEAKRWVLEISAAERVGKMLKEVIEELFA